MSDDPTPPSPAKIEPMAIASLVFGVISLLSSCCCGCFTSPAALLAIALGGVVVAKGPSPSKNYAMAGLACGGVSMVLMVVSSFMGFASQLFSLITSNLPS